MDINEKEMLEVARRVLTGELTRNDLPTLPSKQRVYAAFTMLLALRYELNAQNELGIGLEKALRDIVLQGHETQTSWGGQVTGIRIREDATGMGLYSKGTADNRSRVTLTPPDHLVDLVMRHRNHPAVERFRQEVEAATIP
jgi:hypothetical protein